MCVSEGKKCYFFGKFCLQSLIKSVAALQGQQIFFSLSDKHFAIFTIFAILLLIIYFNYSCKKKLIAVSITLLLYFCCCCCNLFCFVCNAKIQKYICELNLNVFNYLLEWNRKKSSFEIYQFTTTFDYHMSLMTSPLFTILRIFDGKEEAETIWLPSRLKNLKWTKETQLKRNISELRIILFFKITINRR